MMRGLDSLEHITQMSLNLLTSVGKEAIYSSTQSFHQFSAKVDKRLLSYFHRFNHDGVKKGVGIILT